jgi:hypothetical protein
MYESKLFSIDEFNDFVNKDSLIKIHGGKINMLLLFWVIMISVVIIIIVTLCIYLTTKNRAEVKGNNI